MLSNIYLILFLNTLCYSGYTTLALNFFLNFLQDAAWGEDGQHELHARRDSQYKL